MKVSNCCSAFEDESYNEDTGFCKDCKEHCEFVCADCGGTGEIAVDETDGEGHTMKGVGSQKCHCQIKDEE